MKSNGYIYISGARTNNLKNIDVKIKLNSITCISGPSGSGKSSLAFHTLQAEAKRRFINSFPSGQRFFEDVPQRPDVDLIEPVLPVWSLPQNNPIVGSRMNIVDILDLNVATEKLFFFNGAAYCPEHKKRLETPDINTQLDGLKLGSGVLHFFINKNDYVNFFDSSILPSRSFNDEEQLIHSFSSEDNYWEIFRIKSEKISGLENKLDDLSLSDKDIEFLIVPKNNPSSKLLFRRNHTAECPQCGHTLANEFLSPSHLSAFNGVGSCLACNGYGAQLVYDREKLVKNPNVSIKEGAITVMNFSRFQYYLPAMEKFFTKNKIDIKKPFNELPEKKWDLLFEGGGQFPGLSRLLDYLESKKYKKNIRIFIRSLQKEIICPSCMGTRFNSDVYHYCLDGMFLGDFQQMNLIELKKFIGQILDSKFISKNKETKKNIKSITDKLDVAIDLGLGFLSLNEKAKGLHPSEYQRLLLVKYFSYEGSGSLFVLDEPTLGLSLNEQKIVYKYISKLRDQGNTVLIVDHSLYLQSKADELILMGPGAGALGGEITYQGKHKQTKIDKFEKSKITLKEWIALEVKKYKGNDYSIKIPCDAISWVHGESFTAKTPIVLNALANNISVTLNGEKLIDDIIEIKKLKLPDSIQVIELFSAQTLKTNSRSTVGTYIGLSPFLRKKYTLTEQAKELMLKDGHFSSNSALGACPTCEGRGTLVVDMKFLENVVYTCPDCNGMKVRPLYANIKYGDLSFYDSLQLPIKDVFAHFDKTAKINRIIELLEILNLSYLNLDRSLTSLSGGEQQRLKLLLFLLKTPEASLLVFENLSFGLSFKEIFKLCEYFQKILKKSNTIIILDPNPLFKYIAHYSILFAEDNSIKSETL